MVLGKLGIGGQVRACMVAALLAALCCAEAAAQFTNPPPPGAPAAQSERNQYKLIGTVVNSVTADAIPRALVQFMGQSVLTDAGGHFEFQSFSRDVSSVVARKPGYFNEQEVGLGRSAFRSSMLELGPDSAPVVVKLVPEAIVAGRVTGTDREPLENVHVRLRMAQLTNGRRRWQEITSGTTDEDGRYRVGSLRPGRYLISVGAPRDLGLDLPASQPAQGYPLEWYYPGVAERSAAGTIEIGPGQNFQADFALRLQPVFRVAGTVVRPPGVIGVNIQLMTPGGETVGVSAEVQPASGRFEIRSVPAGTYTLRSFAGDQQGHQYSAEVPLTVAANVEGVVLPLAAPLSIPVLVKSELSKPQPEPQPLQSGQLRPPPLQLQLESLDPPDQMFWARQEGPPEHPELVIRDVRPGRYAVQFLPQGQARYAQSATCGNTDLLRAPLVIPSGGQAPPIEVTVRDDVGTLIVSASGEVPETGGQFLILSDSAPMQPAHLGFLPPTGRTPTPGGPGPVFFPTGSAHVAGLAPGEYSVLAFDNVEGLEYANPEVLRRYLPRAVHATVSPNGETKVSVEVIRQEE